MRRRLTAILSAGVLAVVLGTPAAASAGSTAQLRPTAATTRIAKLVARAQHSRYLWATVNVCSAARPGGTFGVRGEMPGLGIPATLTLTIRLNYFSTMRGRFIPLPGSTSVRTVPLGSFRSQAHQGGASFAFAEDPGRLNATVTFSWSRGGRSLGAVTETTTGGHPQAAFGAPAHHSTADCRL